MLFISAENKAKGSDRWGPPLEVKMAMVIELWVQVNQKLGNYCVMLPCEFKSLLLGM